MSEEDKMKELIKKAMKSVSSYNTILQKEKKDERFLYYDLQTMVNNFWWLKTKNISKIKFVFIFVEDTKAVNWKANS